MRGLDNFIMGTHDPSAPFNQVDIAESHWADVLELWNIAIDVVTAAQSFVMNINIGMKTMALEGILMMIYALIDIDLFETK